MAFTSSVGGLGCVGVVDIGKAEVRPDRSYITTSWFCLFIALFPVRTYRRWPGFTRYGLTWTLGLRYTEQYAISHEKLPLYWPHVYGMYRNYFVVFLLLMVADRCARREWPFNPPQPVTSHYVAPPPGARKPPPPALGLPAFTQWARGSLEAKDIRVVSDTEVWIALARTPRDPQALAMEAAAHYRASTSAKAPVKVLLFADNVKIAEAVE